MILHDHADDAHRAFGLVGDHARPLAARLAGGHDIAYAPQRHRLTGHLRPPEVLRRLHKCCSVVRPLMFGSIAREEVEIRRILRKIRHGMPEGNENLARALVAPTDTEITCVE